MRPVHNKGDYFLLGRAVRFVGHQPTTRPTQPSHDRRTAVSFPDAVVVGTGRNNCVENESTTTTTIETTNPKGSQPQRVANDTANTPNQQMTFAERARHGDNRGSDRNSKSGVNCNNNNERNSSSTLPQHDAPRPAASTAWPPPAPPWLRGVLCSPAFAPPLCRACPHLQPVRVPVFVGPATEHAAAARRLVLVESLTTTMTKTMTKKATTTKTQTRRWRLGSFQTPYAQWPHVVRHQMPASMCVCVCVCVLSVCA